MTTSSPREALKARSAELFKTVTETKLGTPEYEAAVQAYYQNALDGIGVLDFLDFTTAWAIQDKYGAELPHHERCSSVPGWDPISGPGLLCDCGAVIKKWEELRDGTD